MPQSATRLRRLRDFRLQADCRKSRNGFLGCGRSSEVEHNLAKVGVVGSNPIARSRIFRRQPAQTANPFECSDWTKFLCSRPVASKTTRVTPADLNHVAMARKPSMWLGRVLSFLSRWTSSSALPASTPATPLVMISSSHSRDDSVPNPGIHPEPGRQTGGRTDHALARIHFRDPRGSGPTRPPGPWPVFAVAGPLHPATANPKQE